MKPAKGAASSAARSAAAHAGCRRGRAARGAPSCRDAAEGGRHPGVHQRPGRSRHITRGSHTLLPPHQVAEVTERALPLLHSPSSTPRTESALGVQAEPSPDMSVTPVVAPHMPPSAKSLQRRQCRPNIGQEGSPQQAGRSRTAAEPAQRSRDPRPTRSPVARAPSGSSARLSSACACSPSHSGASSAPCGAATTTTSTHHPPPPRQHPASRSRPHVTPASPHPRPRTLPAAPKVEFAATCPAPGRGLAAGARMARRRTRPAALRRRSVEPGHELAIARPPLGRADPMAVDQQSARQRRVHGTNHRRVPRTPTGWSASRSRSPRPPRTASSAFVSGPGPGSTT